MNITSQLYRDEGAYKHKGRHAAYLDHLGFWTIGIGRLIDRRKGGGISDVEAAYLLQNDISRITSELSRSLPWWEYLDEVRQAALINMAFQLGTEGLLKFKKTLALVGQGNYAAAGREARNSLWAIQTPERARRVSRQLKMGHWV